MADAISILTAQAASAAARPLMGLSRSPTVVNNDGYVTIELDSDLQDQVADFLIRQLEAAPGAVRIDGLGGVFIKVLIRKYGLWAGGALASAFGLGWFTGAKK